jgi:hypothetical protein
VILKNSLIETDSEVLYLNRKYYFIPSISARLHLMLLSIFLPLLSIVPANAIETNKAEKVSKIVESPIHYVGVPYKSGNRKDPFLAPPKPKSNIKVDEEVSRGVPPPGIAGTFIAQAVLEGISVRNERRKAIVRGRDDRAYFLREGDKLFDGYLKTIQEDSITLVREVTMKSGKTLTQEVTKRLRTP